MSEQTPGPEKGKLPEQIKKLLVPEEMSVGELLAQVARAHPNAQQAIIVVFDPNGDMRCYRKASNELTALAACHLGVQSVTYGMGDVPHW